MNDATKYPFPVVTPAVSPAMSFDSMQRLAESIAKSGLFGIKTADQALTLMSIAQAEGRHPALAARDYHIIQGSPAKKAEAMLRDFLSAGGRVEWHELSDAAAEATFSHPAGGSVRLCWDQARVLQAQLASNPMHRKYPRQMLRSRVISEGVRTVWPMATSGFYVPEEVVEFAPARQPMMDVTPRADLDRFAAGEETGPTDADALRILAEQTAMSGAAAFRDWWRTLDASQRAALRPDIAEYQRVAEAADALAAMEANDDPFGLPTPPTEPTEQSSPDGPAERPGVSAPADSPTRQGEPSAKPAPAPLLDEGENFVVPLAVRPNDEQLAYFTRQMLVLIGERPLDGRRAAMVKQANERGIGFLKLRSVEAYDTIMAALHQTVAS